MRTIIVTGGAGFIGSHLCAKLLEKGDHIICVDNLLTGQNQNIAALKKNQQFTFIEADVTKPFDLSVDKIDAIFHLASPASPNHHSKISYHALAMETMMVNTVGTLQMLRLAKKFAAKFLFASTSEIYGDPLVHPQQEDYQGNVSSTGPRSVYDEAKRFGETLTAYFGRDQEVDARIVRIFNTYGPNMRSDDKRMIINFILQALAGEPITVYGDGNQTRSLCYVDDLVAGLISLGLNEELKGSIVNLGAIEEHSVKEYAEIIIKLTNSNSNIEFSEELPKDDPVRRKPDISRAKNLIDWSPNTPLTQGLQKTVEYFKSL